jgi:hypothetical protein
VRRRTAEKAAAAAEKLERTADKTNPSALLKLSAPVESEPIDTPPPDEDDVDHLKQDVMETELPPAEDVLLPPSPPSWRSAWKARCVLLRSARLFSMLAPSRLAPENDVSLKK